MKKRISRDKAMKSLIQKKMVSKQPKGKSKTSPLLTLNLLVTKTECLQKARQFEKVRIERIVQGSTAESLSFKETQKSVCLQECLHKYYRFSDVRTIFTGLITRNSLVEDITFVDFKLRHFRTMNNYHSLKKQLPRGKGKEEINCTASHSFIADNQHLEPGVKSIIHKQAEKGSHNVSTSFIHMLTKNIEKMIKNIKDQGCLNRDMDFKPVLNNQMMSTPDISHIDHERVHTTPEPMPCDLYGLGQYWNGNRAKPKVENQHQKAYFGREALKETHRFQTEYDTEYIPCAKKSKSKVVTPGSKRSFSKKKVLSRGKSPSPGLKCSLKVKK